MLTLPSAPSNTKVLLAGIPNPFDSQVMHTAWDLSSSKVPDVSDIHAAAERICIEEMERVAKENGQRAVLISGEAGSGKTHLIGRLLRHCEGPDWGVVSCYVNFGAISLQGIWSGVRKYLVQDLLRQAPAGGPTPLERLLGVWLPDLLTSSSPASGHPVSVFTLITGVFGFGASKTGSAALTPAGIQARIAAALPRKVELVRPVRLVLPSLFSEDENVRQDARDWLVGESMSEKTLTALGLPARDLHGAEKEAESKDVVLSLLRLSSAKLPIVLFYDQLEGYMRTPGDRSGYYTFGNFGISLRQETKACLLHLTFVRNDRRGDVKDGMGDAAWARLVERQEGLPPLSWEQGTQLILQRMNHIPELQKIRAGQIAQGQQPFWPFTRERIQGIYNELKHHCTPRGLLQACSSEYTRVLGPMKPDPTLADYLLTLLLRRRSEKVTETPQERYANLLEGLPWLGRLFEQEGKKIADPGLAAQLPQVALVLEDAAGGRVALAACPKYPQVWMRFKGLSENWKKHIQHKVRCKRLLVVSDHPIDAYSGATRDWLDKLLAANGVEFLPTSPETSGALNEAVGTFRALQRLLSDAAVGKLTLGNDTVHEQQVHEWARASLAEPAHPLGCLRVLADDLGFDI